VKGRSLHGILVLVCALALAAFVPKAIWPGATLYRDVLTEGVLLKLGGVIKLAFLAVATAYAALSARRLEPGTPARLPWMLLALGIGAFLAGQSILGAYQLVLQVPSPFPSAADVFFVGAYPLLFGALIAFIRAYREAGYPVGTPGEHALTAAVGAALLAAPTWALLRPILAAPGAPLERALNAAYPLLDVVVLLPILVLLRITSRFRGGQVARVFAGLLAGILFLCAGDVLFAYFSLLGRKELDPLVDATFVLSYFFLAHGALGQYRLLTD
jgi:hypothetical protein